MPLELDCWWHKRKIKDQLSVVSAPLCFSQIVFYNFACVFIAVRNNLS